MKVFSKRIWLLPLIFLSLLPLNYVVSETQVDADMGPEIEQTENNRWGRDPFYRDRTRENNEGENNVEEQEDKVDFLLSAIIFRDGKSVAIINDQIFRPGDKIGTDVIVSRILPHKVFLREGTRTIVLQVKPFGSK